MEEAKAPLYKYEFTEEEVNYYLNAVESLQIRGEQSAVSVIVSKSKLRSPLNVEEIEKYREEKAKESKEKEEEAKKVVSEKK